MTVTYSLNVANARLTGFSKLLIRWKGSIYKLLYREMLIFCTLYYSLSLSYRYILSDSQRLIFEKVAIYCEAFTSVIPLSFVLGFYVSIVVSRWWQQYMQIPWPDKSIMLISGHIHGNDERGRMIRRTLARYLILLQTLTCQAVSTSVRKRFPTLDHIQAAGIMTKEERIAYDEIPGTHGKWWVPAVWYTSLLTRARKEGRIKDDILLKEMVEDLHVFRGCCGMMFAYDWISIPLVYTQTVTIATYSYFLATVMGRQYLDPKKGYNGHEVDLYIPIFTILEFFFFMGWLKVAEQLINPYGEDDDDFDLNWCLDRNLLVSFAVVDDMHNKHPKLVKDMYWDDQEPMLPYTKSSLGLRLSSTQPHLGSAMRLDIDPEEAGFVPLETIMEEDNDNRYRSPPTSPTDLIGLGSNEGSHKEKDDTTSQSGFRGLMSEIRGSRIFNMIIGQSNENVSQTSPTKLLEKNPLPPFLLKTPKKRTRTTSLADSLNNQTNKLHSVASSIQMSNTEFPRQMYGDLPTAPVILHHRTSPSMSRKGTPCDEQRRSFIVDINRDDSGVRFRQGSLDDPNISGFKFPLAYDPSVNPLQYFPPQQEEKKAGDKQSDITSPTSFTTNSRSNSRTTVQENTEVKQDEAKDSPYEPNSSQESITPCESNQSTINSLTELLKRDKD
ncbi:bestrophin-4-like protein [Dinothrombium tinctorium]|uniref:Bestrophin homolog n=1 Tax=Dinothrombium tinctorium TaxID=1965070 RepID=A0A3S3S3R4_9ACAR|nr:bestrophin-4-like protein [Dinothrombium tinctorium]RWS08710.1 bestrophin-4-like protein [Dinothrombium tinctorium]